MKIFTLFIILIIVSGCANTHRFESEAQETNGSEKYELRAQLNKHIQTGFFISTIRNNASLYVNGVLAVSGPLHRDDSGRLQGRYENKPVVMECLKPNFFSNPECTVHINEVNLGRLKMERVR